MITLGTGLAGVRLVRAVVVASAIAALVWLGWRFENVTLPAQGCSPLLRFSPGDSLLVDRRTRTLQPSDALFIEHDGGVHLVLLDTIDDVGRLWVRTDDPECPGFSSEHSGWIDPSAARGRVVMTWPW